jgi:probable HAF family extracellular repeat protein
VCGKPDVQSLEGRVLLTFNNIVDVGQLWQFDPVDVKSETVAINDQVEVAGTTYSDLDDSSEAYFLNSNGQKSSLAPLAGYANSVATGLNNSDLIVGYSSTDSGGFGSSLQEEAVVYNQGVPKGLGTLGGNISVATAINNSNEIVGYSTTTTANNSPTHAFVDKGGTPIDLGTLGGSDSYATAINDNNVIVGYSTTTTSASSPTHMFEVINGKMYDLGVPGGYTSSYATAINASGQIVGYATKPDGTIGGQTETLTEPFMFDHGEWKDLGNLGGIDAVATGIDDAGEVVGYSTTKAPTESGSSPPVNAFVYSSSTGIQNLNKDVTSIGKWTFETATAINVYGVVAGAGAVSDYETDAYVLYPMSSPTPPPPPPPPPTPPPTPTPISPPGRTNAPGSVGRHHTGHSTTGVHVTKTVLTAKPGSSPFGEKVKLTATVKNRGHGGGSPVGSVTFRDGTDTLGTVSLRGGKATLTTSSLPMGPNAIEVQYMGEASFIASTSATRIVAITPARPQARAAQVRAILSPKPVASSRQDTPGTKNSAVRKSN